MKFDLYFPFKGKDGKSKPGIKPVSHTFDEVLEEMKQANVTDLIKSYREGNASSKIELPAVCWTGTCSKTRAIKNMTPTQLVMADIDHCEDPVAAGKEIVNAMGEWAQENVLLLGVTPSGKGLRIVFLAQEGKNTLNDNMVWLKDAYSLDKYGDYDLAVHDFARISFLGRYDELLFTNAQVLEKAKTLSILKNDVVVADSEGKKYDVQPLDRIGEEAVFTDDELKRFSEYEYRGVPPKVILDKYLEERGAPSTGAVHNFYNELVKNFRHICNNDRRYLLYLLPRYGHSIDECWNQIKNICSRDTVSYKPKEFYWFLRKNGFEPEDRLEDVERKQYMLGEHEDSFVMPPYLPPVFRQIINTVPKDFILPCINALMPMLGTLSSYAMARYPYDNRMHTPSFFSVVYAPPGTGKGFVERFMDFLFEDLRTRDFVQSQRENVYLRFMNRRGMNDKAPDRPHTSLRIIPAKNSEAEFLEKQRDNHGYHMFTYAAEMDSWAKGVKAAGGNKDDMIRVAWDNGEYGQQFKSTSTFKGSVNLYWNVLITGTIQQLESYFKNVENGLVTRCCFTSIDNQEFAAPPVWKQISEKSMQTIRDYTKRCDANTYEEPCSVDIASLEMVSDNDFDKEVDWHFTFRPRQEFNCSWIIPTIEAFHERHIKKAALDIDNARDVFRRRVAVRGFRLALLCMTLYKKPSKRDLLKCTKFIDWWMERDLESSLKLWGEKYNEVTTSRPVRVQPSVFEKLGHKFTTNDIYVQCKKLGILTPVRRIVHEWKKLGCIEVGDKDTYIKKQ